MIYRWIGWCKDRSHDKVWGVILLEDPRQIGSITDDTVREWALTLPPGGGKCVIFWGRRGKKLQTKLAVDNRDTSKLIDSKADKGYKKISPAKLAEVYPEFEADLEKTAVYAILGS